MLTPIASIDSQTTSLTVAVFDASSAGQWVPAREADPAPHNTGHPWEIISGLARNEHATPIDVGPAVGLAFELEGTSGKIELYRSGESLVLVAPPRGWWQENHPDEEFDNLFTAALESAEDATDVGALELSSGKLLAVYMWMQNVDAARVLDVPNGGAVELSDRAGVVVDLGVGTYRVARHELEAEWDDSAKLVAMYVIPEGEV